MHSSLLLVTMTKLYFHGLMYAVLYFHVRFDLKEHQKRTVRVSTVRTEQSPDLKCKEEVKPG